MGSHFLPAQVKKMDTLVFQPMFGDSTLVLSTYSYKLNDKDSIQFDVLKFYISGIEFLNKGKPVWKEENSFHLIDASQEKTMSVILKRSSSIICDQIKFNIGIDSTINVSGAMGGDLDPTKGMYWTWQSGYINFKLEGISNVCKSKNQEFQYHVGGYESPFNAFQTVTLDCKRSNKIEIDIKELLSGIDLSKQDHIMSPSAEAVVLAQKISKTFSVQAQ